MEEKVNVILECEKLIYHLINKYYYWYQDKDDLYQVAVMSLDTAYKNFDASRGVKFSSFASYHILGEMKRYIRESKIIKISKEALSLKGKIERVRDELTQKLMREPTMEEIALFLGVDETLLYKAVEETNTVISLNQVINNEDKEIELLETVPSDRNNCLDNVIDLKDRLANLSNYERSLVVNRYVVGLNQEETAVALETNQTKVSRDENKILNYIRRP